MNKYSELLKELKIEIAANVLVEAKKSPVRIKDKGEVEEAIAEKGIDSKELSTAEMDKQSGRSRKEEEEFDTPDETLPDYDVAGEDLSLTQEEEEADAATAEEERTKSAMEAWQLNFPIKKKIKLDKMLTPHIATLKQEYLRREPNNSVIDETIKEIESVKKKLNAEFKLIKNPFDYYFEYEVDILTDELMLKKAFGATHTTLIDIDTTFAHDLKTYKIVRKSSVDKVIKHITDTISSKHKNEPEHFKTFIKDTV